jgi:hypothetical protein
VNFVRHFVRWIAVLVLLNIGLGFCDCLRENTISGGSAKSATLTSHRNHDAPSDCGDNCESCICHATVLMVRPETFKISLGISWLPGAPGLSFSDPDRTSLTQPPRA